MVLSRKLIFFSVFPICFCSFMFNNYTLVEKAAFDIGEDYCNCIVVQRSPNDNYEQKWFLDKLTASIAKGTKRFGKNRRQTMSYFFKNYLFRYTGETNLQNGNCFKWLNIVMVTEDTNLILQKFVNPIIFKQAVWVFFANGSTSDLFQNVNLQIDSSVWLVEAQSNNLAKVTEVYRVTSHGSERRRLLGLWSYEQGLDFKIGTKAVRRKNLRGTVFRVGTYQVWPVTAITKNENGKIAVDGYYPKVWKELEAYLNFSSQYVLSNENSTGGVSKGGNVSGLLGMSLANEIDVILLELDYSSVRLDIVEHLIPISRTNFQVYTRVEGYSFDWLAVFHPFYIDIWVALLLWILIGSFIMTSTSYVTFYFGMSAEKISLIDAAYFILRTLSYQGSNKIPHLWTGRVLFILCYLVAGIIIPSYSAALISSLTKRTPARPFDSLAEALRYDYNVLVPENTSSYEYFSQSKDPLLKKALKENKKNSEQWLNSISGYNDTINYLCQNKKTAVFTIEAAMEKSIIELPAACSLQSLSQPVAQVYQSLGLRKHSPYRTTTNYFILKMMEAGLLQRFQKMYLTSKPLIIDKFTKTVDLADVSEIFVFLILSYLLCGIILIFEKQFFLRYFSNPIN